MIARTLQRMDGRYPNAREKADLLAYVSTSRARRMALEEVRQKVTAVVDDLIAAMRQRYPEFAKLRSQGFEKGHRDMVLLTSMAANAMFLGETDTLDDMFTHWYRSILKAVHLSPQFLQDTFALWMSSLQRHLSPDTYELLRPVAAHLSHSLTQVPDPPRDEDGRRQA